MKIIFVLMITTALAACGGGQQNPSPAPKGTGSSIPGTGDADTGSAGGGIPAAVNYQLPFIALVAGTYPGNCGGNPGTATISADGILGVPNASFNAGATNVALILSRQLVKQTDLDQLKVSLSASGPGQTSAGADWSLTGALDQFAVSLGVACYGDPKAAAQFSRTVDVGAAVLALVRGHQETYPDLTCSDKSGFLPAGLTLSADGLGITLGQQRINLTAARVDEFVNVNAVDPGQTDPAYEPGFYYSADYVDGSTVRFAYGGVHGFWLIQYVNAQGEGVSCLRK